MYFYIILLVEVIIAIGVRAYYHKQEHKFSNNSWDILKFGILGLTGLVNGYFVFDTLIGFSTYVVAVMLYGVLMQNNYRKDFTQKNSYILALVMPLFVVSIIWSMNYILITPTYILLPLILISGILFASMKSNFDKNYLIAFVIGIAITIGIIYPLRDQLMKDYDYKKRIAIEYIDSELDYTIDYIYSTDSLRGETAEIRVFDQESDAVLILMYKNGEIIDYKVKN